MSRRPPRTRRCRTTDEAALAAVATELRAMRVRLITLSEQLGAVSRAAQAPSTPAAESAGAPLAPEDGDAAVAPASASTDLRERRAAAYARLRDRLREDVLQVVPEAATVLVVTRGDGDLLDLPGRTAGHFPVTDDGTWAGHHPAD